MTKLEQLLSQYAAYHLDRKNIYTHFIGIPMIVVSLICLMARAEFTVAGLPITLALIVMTLSVLYYLKLDLVFGGLMALLLALVYPFALWTASLGLSVWLTTSIGLFVVGWIFQFVGHFYEKKKPAFVDDLVGLIIGPLFVLAEWVFLLGFRKSLEEKMLIEARRLRADMDSKELQTASS